VAKEKILPLLLLKTEKLNWRFKSIVQIPASSYLDCRSGGCMGWTSQLLPIQIIFTTMASVSINTHICGLLGSKCSKVYWVRLHSSYIEGYLKIPIAYYRSAQTLRTIVINRLCLCITINCVLLMHLYKTLITLPGSLQSFQVQIW
jgi:hypothetical protein